MDSNKLDISRMMEDPYHIEEEKCCGNCCWFAFEDTDGDGQCMKVGLHGTPYGAPTHCSTPHCKKHYLSNELRDKYRNILLKADEWYKNEGKSEIPDANDFKDAIEFAHKYIDVFSKL